MFLAHFLFPGLGLLVCMLGILVVCCFSFLRGPPRHGRVATFLHFFVTICLYFVLASPHSLLSQHTLNLLTATPCLIPLPLSPFPLQLTVARLSGFHFASLSFSSSAVWALVKEQRRLRFKQDKKQTKHLHTNVARSFVVLVALSSSVHPYSDGTGRLLL